MLAASQFIADRIVGWRRHFHANPERSGEEEQTARYVAIVLRELGLAPQECVGGTWGLVADIDAGTGPAIALRADMDALPVAEENDVDYRSQNEGVMHACGHDAHMAMLLGAAALLVEQRQQMKQPVRLIFQPSEELHPGGAQPMVAAGVLENVGCIFGLHVWAGLPSGTLGTRCGPFMASPDNLKIVVHGKGGHAAMPQQCIDPIVIAAQVILGLQTVVSRSLSLAEQGVVSVTRVHGGTASNVIPPSVEMAGTIRTLEEHVRHTVHARVRAVAEGIAEAHGGSVEVAISSGYPALVNDAAMVETALAAARRVGFAEGDLLTLPPQGGGEDFAYFAQQVPGAFLFLGAQNEDVGACFPHHHPRFNIDEAALPRGAALLAQIALDGAA